MALFSFFGSLMIAGAVAVLFEKRGWSHNGMLPSILITFGAVVVMFFLRALFGLSIGAPGLDAIIGSTAALVLIPTEYAHRRRQRDRRR